MNILCWAFKQIDDSCDESTSCKNGAYFVTSLLSTVLLNSVRRWSSNFLLMASMSSIL